MFEFDYRVDWLFQWGLDQSRNRQGVHEYEVEQLREDERIEDTMVAATDAVVYPIAMVVKFTDTSIANITMSTICRVRSFTIWTEAIWVQLLD